MKTLYFYKNQDGYQEYPIPSDDELKDYWPIEVNDDFVYQGQRVDASTGQLNPVIPDDVLIKQIQIEQKSRMNIAGAQIEILSDMAMIDGSLSSDDAALLQSWRQYRVDVYNVTKQATYPQLVDWPKEPA